MNLVACMKAWSKSRLSTELALALYTASVSIARTLLDHLQSLTIGTYSNNRPQSMYNVATYMHVLYMYIILCYIYYDMKDVYRILCSMAYNDTIARML